MKCALELFSEHGYEAVSPNDIVEKAGVKKPTLYYFFGSKEGVLSEILKINYTVLDDLIAQACIYIPNPEDYNNDIHPVLLRTVKTFFSFAEENTSFYLMVLAMSFAPPSSRVADISGKYHANHYILIEKMFGEMSSVHSNLANKEKLLSIQFLALINAQIGFWYRKLGSLNQETAESIVKQFMHGIFS